MEVRPARAPFGGWGHRIVSWVSALLRDVVAVLTILIGIITFLCCATYSPDDPSFLQATDKISGNLFGMWGATYSDFVLQALGYSAHIMSCLFILWGSGLFRGRIATSIILRLMYMPPILMLFSASLEMLFGYLDGPAGNGAGGSIGSAVATSILYVPAHFGDVVVFFTKLMTSALAVAGLVFISGRKLSLPLMIFKPSMDQKKSAKNTEKKPVNVKIKRCLLLEKRLLHRKMKKIIIVHHWVGLQKSIK